MTIARPTRFVAALAGIAVFAAACRSLPPLPPATAAPPSAAAIAPETTLTTTASQPTAPETVGPSPRVGCGRIRAADCHASIELVRAADPDRVAAATTIVVDDTCPPTALCDRRYPFAVAVVLASGVEITGTYLVVGRTGPEQVLPWHDALPAHILAQLATLTAG